jgi:hypothetical protein
MIFWHVQSEKWLAQNDFQPSEIRKGDSENHLMHALSSFWQLKNDIVVLRVCYMQFVILEIRLGLATC